MKNFQRFFLARGFTFVEIVLVMSLLSIISVALYNALANGLKVWDRGVHSFTEQEALIFFDKLTRDVHNAFPSRVLPVDGRRTYFVFPSIVRKLAGPNMTEYADQVVMVKYDLDIKQRALVRREANYGQAVNSQYPEASVLLPDIKAVQFRYLYPSFGKDVWGDQTKGELPSAVEVSVEFGSPKAAYKMRRLILIPLGKKKMEIVSPTTPQENI